MSNPVFMDLYKRGLISKADYIQAVGEDPDPQPEKPEVTPARAQSQDQNVESEKIKKDPERDARVKSIIGEVEYQQPDPSMLARAEALSQRMPGEGWACPLEQRKVKACPKGNIRVCASHVRCQFAAVTMSQSLGAALSDQVGDDGTVTVNNTTDTAVGRAAAQAGSNNALAQQALALMKMRQRYTR